MSKFVQNRKLLYVIGAVVGVMLCACIGCLAIGAIRGSSPEFKATQTARAVVQAKVVQPTETPKSIDTPIPTNTPKPPEAMPTETLAVPTDTPAPTDEPPFIPGIMPADVKLNLEERRFTCGDVEEGVLGDKSFYMWRCVRDEANMQLQVSVTSRSLLTVDTINASIRDYQNFNCPKSMVD